VSEPRPEAALRAEVRGALAEWRAAGVFEPGCDGWCRGFSSSFSKRLAARGWVGMTIPERYGGPGRTPQERFIVAEELLAAGAPVTAHWAGERQIAPMLLHTGTEEQRERFLPRIARGEITFSIGMSEPQTGSDLSSVRTRARHEGDHWVLSGQKIWSTAAHLADYMILLCRTSGAHGDRHQGLSQLLVDLRAPSVDIRPIMTMNGEADFCEVFFNDVVVPERDVIGAIGSGWTQVTTELSFERSGPDRYMSTFPLIDRLIAVHDLDSPEAQATCGRLIAELVALRGLSMDVVDSAARGDLVGAKAALCKDAGTLYEQDSVELVRDLCLEEPQSDPVLGALLRDMTLSAPMITLRGGTTEILRGITARSLTA
jgi:acyl-CoA dehydrogenase